jgi:hypothetical protein
VLPANQSSSFCLAEFEDYSSYSKAGLQKMLSETNETSWTVSKIVGQFGGDGGESALDVQYGGTLARGTEVWFWTESKWMLGKALIFLFSSIFFSMFRFRHEFFCGSRCAFGGVHVVGLAFQHDVQWN